MRRIYYAGAEPGQDSRLAGVKLVPGAAVDVPEELAETLVAEGNFAAEPQERADTITWYEPEPGVELLALDGIGEGRAAWLVDYGIPDLAAMAALDIDRQDRLAEDMPRVGEEDVRAWVGQAGELLTEE